MSFEVGRSLLRPTFLLSYAPTFLLVSRVSHAPTLLLPTVSCLSTIGYQLSAISYRLSAISYRLSAVWQTRHFPGARAR